jgi:hypothetical protein
MALIPVTRETLGSKRLKATPSYAFAAKAAICEIVAAEFARAATAFPIFFVQRDGALSPFTLFGLEPTENLYVEADGGWSGSFIPAALRRYPFVVQATAEGQPQLFIDDATGHLSDSEGEPLFGTDERSDLASPVGRALQSITLLDVQRGPTRALIARIAETGIIQPITIAADEGEATLPIGGLHAINEASLNALPDATLIELRSANALPLIYAQMISMGHVQTLKARRKFRQAMAAARQA